MKTVVHHGPTSVRRGDVGSHVELHLLAEADGEWSGVYHFASHGMSPQAFTKRVHAIERAHHAKSQRLTGFVALREKEFTVGGAVYRIIDCNLVERGTDYELMLRAVRVLGPKQFVPILRMDHRDGLLYPSVDAVPSDAEIEMMVRTMIATKNVREAAHAKFVADVAAAMTGG